MADKKISALTASTTPLAGTEVLPIVQSGSTVKVSIADVTAGRAVSASSVTASTGNFIVGASGQGITTGSAIPLGFGVNNTVTAMTINTSGNVGIGLSSPLGILHTSTESGQTTVFVDAYGGAAAVTGRTASGTRTTPTTVVANQSLMFFGARAYNGTAFTSTASALMNIFAAETWTSTATGSYISFATTPIGSTTRAEAMRIAANDVTVSTGNLKIGTAGKGIDFSANTHAAGMTSELLNWYEVGTWTGTLTAATSPTTPITKTGRYTRIGNQITVAIEFDNVDTTGASGAMEVTGLPFAAVSAGYGPVMKSGIGTQVIMAGIYGGLSKVIFSDAGTMSTTSIVAGAGVYLRFSATYFV